MFPNVSPAEALGGVREEVGGECGEEEVSVVTLSPLPW